MSLLQSANVSISTINENTIVTAVANSTIKVYKALILNGAASAQTVTVKDKASGNTIATLTLPSSIGNGYNLGDGNVSDSPLFITQAGGALIFNLSAATQVSGFILYEVTGA